MQSSYSEVWIFFTGKFYDVVFITDIFPLSILLLFDSLLLRPFPPPVFDHLQYTKTEKWTDLDVTQVTPCIEHVPTNTRPHQLRWGDREMYSHDSAFSYKKSSQWPPWPLSCCLDQPTPIMVSDERWLGHLGSDGTYKVVAAITQFAGGSKKYLGTNHAELA